MILEYLSRAVANALPDAVVRIAADLPTALQAAQQSRLDMVLLDLGLPGCGGLDSIVRFRKEFPDISVLVFSSTDDEQTIFGALGVGAAGFVPKTAGPKMLMQALRAVVRGERFIPHEFLAAEAGRQSAEEQEDGKIPGRRGKP